MVTACEQESRTSIESQAAKLHEVYIIILGGLPWEHSQEHWEAG